MDIQVNYTGRVMYYLAKYMSKVDATVNVQYGMEDMQTHFQARQLGAVDAAYYACGWNKHRSSRSTIYISAVFPGADERRQLRLNLGSLRADDTNIFTKTHTEKYLNRHQQTAAMTFPEYFTVYMLSEEQDASDDILELGEERFGVYDRTSVANQIEQEVLDIRIGPLDANSEPGGLMRPVECVDNFKMRYRARLRKRLPLWRTHLYDQTTVEPFFYQMVVLYYPIANAEVLENLCVEFGGTWRGLFFNVCDRGEFRLGQDRVEIIRRIDEAMQEQELPATVSVTESNLQEGMKNAVHDLAIMLPTLSPEQETVFKHITYDVNQSTFVVYKSAGTDKSYLLALLRNAFLVEGIIPITLAPTGVAAHTIGGQTYHSFFGLDAVNQDVNLVRLESYIKIHERIVFLVDECSMISSTTLDKMSNALQRIIQQGEDFSGATIIFFGDLAQLSPINLAEGYFFQNRFIHNAVMTELRTQQRQDPEETDFIAFLQQLRKNKFDAPAVRYIQSHHFLERDIPASALRLFPDNHDTDATNEQCLQRAEGVQQIYTATDNGPPFALLETRLMENLLLKLNVPCMLVHNLDVENGWTNGTRCTVTVLAADYIIITRLKDG